MAYVVHAPAIGTSLVARAQNMRAQFEAALSKRAMYRTTVNELSALSDRELADLGIHRSAIKGIANEAANAAK